MLICINMADVHKITYMYSLLTAITHNEHEPHAKALDNL